MRFLILLIVPVILIVVGYLIFAFGMHQAALDKGGECPRLEVNIEVWLDQNGDGVRQSDEPPIPNVQPILMDAESALGVTTVLTEWDGFGRIEASYAPKKVMSVFHCQFFGKRKVTIDVPDGYELTTPDQRTVPSSSSLSFGLKRADDIVPSIVQHIAKTDCQSFKKPNRSSAASKMESIVDSNEQLWIVKSYYDSSRPNEVARYDKATQKMTWTTLRFYIRAHWDYDATHTVDGDGVHWSTVSDHSSGDKVPYSLYRFDGTDQPIVNVIDGFELGEVYTVLSTASGNLWLETEHGLIFYNIKSKTHTHYPQFTAPNFGKKRVFLAGDEIVYFVDTYWFAIGRGNPAEQVVEWEIYNEQNSEIPLVSTSDEYFGFENPQTDFDGNIWFNGGDLYYNPDKNQWHYPAVDQAYSAHATQSPSHVSPDHVYNNYFPTHDGNLWVYHPIRHAIYYVHNTRYADKSEWPVLRLNPDQYFLYAESDNVVWLDTSETIERCEITFTEE